jgi:diguanylate cyclase (GGDEF)-like protein
VELERLVQERTADVEAARQRAELQATIDPLTGALNRRGLMELAERETKLAARRQGALAVIVLDLDGFKRINDQHGHTTGDRVLCDIVAAVRGTIRETDLFGRIGGEEFLIALPDTDAEAAALLAQRIRRRFAESISVGDPPQAVTASFGIACVSNSGYDLAATFANADAALYRAKRAGKNRVDWEGPRRWSAATGGVVG